MALKIPEKKQNGPSFRRPFFVARTVFDDPQDMPSNFGLDGSPYSADGLRVSEEEYWEKYYEVRDYHYEWNNGILEEKPVSDFATVQIYQWLFTLVGAYLQTNPIAKLICLETGFRLKFDGKKFEGKEKVTIRKPDFFVVRDDNPIFYPESANSFPGIADLCVEAISRSSKKNLERDTRTKRIEYELVGVREFYMLDASGKDMKFFRRTPQGTYQEISTAADGIVRSEVLPGFQFRLVDLYRQPSPVSLTEDEVYRDFVLPELSAMRLKVEQEHLRAERLAAKLKKLGIDEDDE